MLNRVSATTVHFLGHFPAPAAHMMKETKTRRLSSVLSCGNNNGRMLSLAHN
jgi:hypothetical protein